MTVGYFHYSNCTTSIKVPSGALQKKSLTFLSLDKVGSDKYTDDAKTIIDWIKKQGVLTFKRSDCHKAMHGRFPKEDELVKAMETLSGWNVISGPENIYTEGSNRATVIYRVNPRLLTNN